VDFLNDAIVSNVFSFMLMFVVVLVLLLSQRFLIKPLPRWVLESINWVSFLNSSPWLWQDALVSRGESMDFFNNTIVTDILSLVVMVMVVLLLSQ